MKRVDALHAVMEELASASDMFGMMYSPHEGLAIIREEYKELEREVFKQFDERSFITMQKEAKQLAAMAIRFMIDIT